MVYRVSPDILTLVVLVTHMENLPNVMGKKKIDCLTTTNPSKP